MCSTFGLVDLGVITSAKPWLTAILDDYSWTVPGYFLGFQQATVWQTALTLHDH